MGLEATQIESGTEPETHTVHLVLVTMHEYACVPNSQHVVYNLSTKHGDCNVHK